MRIKRLIISIFDPKNAKPKLIAWAGKLIPHTASGAARIVAVPPEGKRLVDGRPVIADANLVKITESGKLYRYHTINPLLGIPLDVNGRMLVDN